MTKSSHVILSKKPYKDKACGKKNFMFWGLNYVLSCIFFKNTVFDRYRSSRAYSFMPVLPVFVIRIPICKSEGTGAFLFLSSWT